MWKVLVCAFLGGVDACNQDCLALAKGECTCHNGVITNCSQATSSCLELYGCDISELKVGAFDGINIDTLIIEDNPRLIALENGIFDGLEDKVYDLDLRNNGIAVIGREVFRTWPILDDLFLFGNELQDLNWLSSSDMPLLDRLWLHNNRIASIPPGTFEGTPALTQLRLDGNSIDTVEDGVFEGMEDLRMLNLCTNAISALSPGSFDLSSLTVLDVSFNRLTTLATGSFDGVPSLDVLSLNGNRLTTLEPGGFQNLPNLTTLYLFENQLASIPEASLSGLESVHELRLDRNALLRLDAQSLEGLSSSGLGILYLSDNQLSKETVAADLFVRFENLILLNLVGNENIACSDVAFPNAILECTAGFPASDLEQVAGVGDFVEVLSPYGNIENTGIAVTDGFIGTQLYVLNANSILSLLVVPVNGPVVVAGVQFTSGVTRSYDPRQFLLEGSNQTDGTGFEPIFGGQGPIVDFSSRYQTSPVIRFPNNAPHLSFRLTLQSNGGNVQLAELTFWGAKPLQEDLPSDSNAIRQLAFGVGFGVPGFVGAGALLLVWWRRSQKNTADLAQPMLKNMPAKEDLLGKGGGDWEDINFEEYIPASLLIPIELLQTNQIVGAGDLIYPLPRL
jgi:hypothetical protein